MDWLRGGWGESIAGQNGSPRPREYDAGTRVVNVAGTLRVPKAAPRNGCRPIPRAAGHRHAERAGYYEPSARSPDHRHPLLQGPGLPAPGDRKRPPTNVPQLAPDRL